MEHIKPPNAFQEALQNLLRIPEPQATMLVYNHATYFPKHTKIWIPFRPYQKLKEAYDSLTKTQPKTKRLKRVQKEVTILSSLTRSHRELTNKIQSNEFDYWVTFTFANQGELTDDDVTRKMKRWLKRQRETYGAFRYAIVIERHKNGTFHFHGVIGGYKGPIKPAVYADSGRPVIIKNRRIHHLTGFSHGFTNAQFIGNKEAVSKYITKYLTKDLTVMDFNKKRYWCSTGLKMSESEDNISITVPEAEELAKNKYSTPYGTTYYLPPADELPPNLQ